MTSIKKDFSVTKGIQVQTSIKIGDAPAKNALLDSATVTQFVQKPEIASSITAVSGLISKVYDSADLLPLSGNAAGDFGFVNSTNRLYLWNGSGWYNIALINSTPTLSTTPDSNYSMDSVGASLSITILASDPEEVPIAYSYLSDSASNFVTITQDSNVFTISPLTQAQLDSNGVGSGGTFTITFRASDGINIAPAVSSFTLTLPIDWSNATNTQAFEPAGLGNSDYFGIAVGIDGDYIIAGAQGDDDAGSNAGAAYILYKSGGTWSQQAKLTTQAASFSGSEVAIGGTTPGSKAYVGMPSRDSSTGRVVIYTRSGTTWTAQNFVQGSSNSNFGYAIDANGDDFIVGAHRDDTGGSDRGKVFVYTGTGTLQQALQASDAENYSYFGWSVAIHGNLAVVGANRASTSAGGLANSKRGAVYVFERSGSTWTQKTKILSTEPSDDQRFGEAVGCYEGTSSNTIVIGAYNNKAYIYTGSGTSYTEQAKLLPSDLAAGDAFGQELEIDKTASNNGDFVFISSFLHNTTPEGTFVNGSGAAYIFKRSGTSWSQVKKLTAFTKGPSDGALFGYNIAAQDQTVVVGASGEDNTQPQGGAVYIFDA